MRQVAFIGFAVQALVTREQPIEGLTKHLSDPFGHNIITNIGNLPVSREHGTSCAATALRPACKCSLCLSFLWHVLDLIACNVCVQAFLPSTYAS